MAPPIARSLVCSPSRPPPGCTDAPPLPLSRTSNSRVSPELRIASMTDVADLCFTMLVSSSATVKYEVDSTSGPSLQSRSEWTATFTEIRATKADTAASSPLSVSTAG